jgi:hypothetical protein
VDAFLAQLEEEFRRSVVGRPRRVALLAAAAFAGVVLIVAGLAVSLAVSFLGYVVALVALVALVDTSRPLLRGGSASVRSQLTGLRGWGQSLPRPPGRRQGGERYD